MGAKARLRSLDERLTGGALRRWYATNAVLGSVWGEFIAMVEAVPAGARVLDLGAGEATLRARLDHARYIAIDRGIGHAGWDYSALDVVGDASSIPVADGTFDLVICKQVLEHVVDPIALLREAARVLVDDGVLLLSTNQAWPQHQQPYDFFRFTSFGLRYCFEKAGLEIERMEPMGGAFSAALFHASQMFGPHIWARSPRGVRIATLLLRPVAWIMRALMPLVTALDRLDRTKDNTLGYMVVARARSTLRRSSSA